MFVHNSYAMMSLAQFIVFAFAAVTFAFHSPPPIATVPKVLNISTVFQFNNTSAWIENLAARSNGDLIITRQDTPEVWNVNPTTSIATLLHTFANATTAFGIDEYAPDVFAVATGKIEVLPVLRGFQGSFDVWSIDLRRGIDDPVVELIARIDEARFLNGLTAINKQSNTVLVADSQAGLVWAVDTRAKTYRVAISDPTTMAPRADAQFPLGINGVRVYKDLLYYTSDATAAVYRVPISSNGSAKGGIEFFADAISPDDFAIDRKGTLYVTTNPSNSLEFVPASGVSGVVLVGGLNQTILAGATSAVFGRGSDCENVLFVCTSGGKAAPVNGTYVEAGKIVKIELLSTRI